jgi:hypothetical protein
MHKKTEEILADRIPADLHSRVIQLANKTYNMLTIDAVTLGEIFQIWNTYIDPNETDMSCINCRMRVIGRFRQIAQIYEARQEPK